MKMNTRGIVSLAAMGLVFALGACKKKDAAAVDTTAMAPPANDASCSRSRARY